MSSHRTTRRVIAGPLDAEGPRITDPTPGFRSVLSSSRLTPSRSAVEGRETQDADQ